MKQFAVIIYINIKNASKSCRHKKPPDFSEGFLLYVKQVLNIMCHYNMQVKVVFT